MDTGVLKHSAYDSLCEQTLVQATVFKDKNELLQKAQTLLINRDNDIIGSKLHSYLAQEMKSKADFNDFVSLVSNWLIYRDTRNGLGKYDKMLFVICIFLRSLLILCKWGFSVCTAKNKKN